MLTTTRTTSLSGSWTDLFRDLDLDSVLSKIMHDADVVCPSEEHVFRCFSYFDVLDTKVVICGQDPYHTPGVANGLAFDAVSERIPPSLRNIFKEVKRTYPDARCNIEEWAKQGVLMFNRSMTVETNKPNSHVSYWKPITNMMIRLMNDYWKENDHCVIFLLWGNNAKELMEFIDDTYHGVLTHTHPSPLSRKPFVGNDHFKLCNEHLSLQPRAERVQW